jgi:hypothetical protein
MRFVTFYGHFEPFTCVNVKLNMHEIREGLWSQSFMVTNL